MNYALQKTLELLLIIGLGLLLQKKVAKDDLKGIKTLILSVALPATIFVALLKIELKGSLLVFPLMALVFNFIMVIATKYLLAPSLPNNEGAKKRTLTMLLPSLAPGLSCFPFIIVYLGDEYLALAALADVGNKIFVLILLYMLGMHWYHARAVKDLVATTSSKLKGLFLSMLNEPINLVIIVAMVLLGFGLTLSSFPDFLGNTIVKMSLIMTPLVLLFIGMAVRIKFREFGFIFSLLMRRAGITFLLSAIFVFLFPALAAPMILFIVVFPQSACSFWPFAHMSAVSTLEEKDEQKKPTFDINFAVNILACSMPFSTILIISIFSFSEFFVNPVVLVVTGIIMVAVTYIPYLITKLKRSDKTEEVVNYNTFFGINTNAHSSENH
ncbi:MULTISPECIES: permease [Arenibacter]|uniref:permease n=1 Tax=Arenibacter TaxID=178469 RepID=UPI001C06B68A|nr:MULTISPECIES: permease [Arenibacter]MBU2906190.1 permease [Arenibacter algicola]MCK0135061.1 permease [Arenibacter sp. S6351L]